MDGRGAVSNSDQYVIDGDRLIIKDVCAISDGDGMSYRCGGVLPTGTTVMGGDYHVEPLGEHAQAHMHECTHKHIHIHIQARTHTAKSYTTKGYCES